jgi:hypothetical protein
VHRWLAIPRRGQVLATFARSAYLDVGGTIIAVVHADLLNGPLNIVLDGDVVFERIPVGTIVDGSERRIRIEGGAEIDMAHISIWEARLPRWTQGDGDGVRSSLPSVTALLLSEAPEASFAHYLRDATTVVPRVQHALSVLEAGLTQRSVEVLTRAAGELAGLGSGLTPSGDDVLIGTLVALTVCPDAGAQGFRPAILGAAGGRTTRISEVYLDAAARGEAGEAWHRFARVLPSRDDTVIVSAARRVMAFGETSGSDMLAGFILATSALIS